MRYITLAAAAVLLIAAAAALNCSPRVAPVSEYTKQPFDPRGLITVNDPGIQQRLKAILAEGNDVRTDFRRIEDWVADNVVYDPVTNDNWQWPMTTLNTLKGDCKDYSTLLCTLWRADGVPPSDVYVAIGQGKNNARHAFVIERYLNGTWHVVEPQVGGFVLSELSAVDTAEKYAITFLFNDVEYINEPSSILMRIRGVGPAPVSRPAQKPAAPKINSFSSDRSFISAGDSVRLSWDVSGATYIGIDQGVGSVSPVGTCTITPRDTEDYRLVATNDGGSVMGTLTIRVATNNYSQPAGPSLATAGAEEASFMIGFDGWYTSAGRVEVANVGQLVAARLNLRGGSPGQYIIRMWRALTSGHDELLTQSSFNYQSQSEEAEISFSPAYSIGESGTHGYWVDLLVNGEQVWAMPNGYPPRLTAIPRPSTGALNVAFIGWFLGTDPVPTAHIGQEITTGITLSGGDEGKYVIYVKRDTVGTNDESAAETSFIYDGTSTMEEITFSPQYASQDGGTRGYYLELYKDGKYLWSLGGNYPPRLMVTR